MTDNVQRVRIDRLVLRGVDIDMHDAASLPARIAAAIEHARRERGNRPAQRVDAHDIVVAIAQRVYAAVDSRREAP